MKIGSNNSYKNLPTDHEALKRVCVVGNIWDITCIWNTSQVQTVFTAWRRGGTVASTLPFISNIPFALTSITQVQILVYFSGSFTVNVHLDLNWLVFELGLCYLPDVGIFLWVLGCPLVFHPPSLRVKPEELNWSFWESNPTSIEYRLSSNYSIFSGRCGSNVHSLLYMEPLVAVFNTADPSIWSFAGSHTGEHCAAHWAARPHQQSTILVLMISFWSAIV